MRSPLLATFALISLPLLASCSLSRESDDTSVIRLQLDPAQMASFAAAQSGSTPNASAGFQCFAVNVVGPGIAPAGLIGSSSTTAAFLDALLSGTSYCSYLGVSSAPLLLSADQTTVELTVPSGPSRLVQLLGIVDPQNTICKRSDPLTLNPTVASAQIYELGRASVDLSGDRTVTLRNTYDSLPVAQQVLRQINCGAATPTTVVSGTPATQLSMSLPDTITGGCTGAPFQVFLLDADGNPASPSTPTPVSVNVNGVQGKFYRTAACADTGTSSYNETLPIGANGTGIFYFKATVGGISASFTASASGITPITGSRPYAYTSCVTGMSPVDSQFNSGANAASGDTNDKAQSFTPLYGTAVSDASMGGWIHPIGPPSGIVDLSIYPDAAGFPDRGSSPMATCTAGLPTSVGDFACSFPVHPFLTGGQTYWLVAEHSTQSFIVQGCNGSCSSTGGAPLDYDGSSWQPAPASALRYIFTVNGCTF